MIPEVGVQLLIDPTMPACCTNNIPDTQNEQHDVELCKSLDPSSDESFAESNHYEDDADNLTGSSFGNAFHILNMAFVLVSLEIYEFEGDLDEILTVGEEVIEVKDDEDEDVSTLTQSLSIESLGIFWPHMSLGY